MDTFSSGSIMHAMVVIAGLVVLGLAVWISRRFRQRCQADGDAFRRWLGIAILIFEIVHNLYWLILREDGFDLIKSLPIHICDITGFLVAIGLIWPKRRVVSLVYFWGAGLSITAFIVPVIEEGPAFLVFWTFWMSHIIVVGGAYFFVLAEDYRPIFRDLVFAQIVSVIYGLIMLGLNISIGSNYGYIGEVSPATSFLGPWPARVPLLLIAGCVLEFFAWLPFWWINRRTNRALVS